MMRNTISICLCVSSLILVVSWNVHANSEEVTSLSDIKQFTKKELKRIRARYSEYQTNSQLFSGAQFNLINEKELSPILRETIPHKEIKLDNTSSLLDFADDIKSSGFTFFDLESRIIKYIENGEAPFAALRKAIEREKIHRWKLMQKERVTDSNDPFVKTLNELRLLPIDRKKTISAYAVCIKPFSDPTDRKQMMTPRICSPIDDYPTPRHFTRSVHVKETLSLRETPQVMAYQELLNEAKTTAQVYKLDAFEKVLMAKCIAEQSLRFFVPAHHPIKAVNKTCTLHKNTPEKAFFMHSGVCGNFSAIAYNIANSLGLMGNIFLVRHRVHMYLELKDGDHWYHSHPFNSKSKCDLIKF